MPKYRKKPVVVEAFRWLIDEVPDWWKGLHVQVQTATGVAVIPTLEGKMSAQPGDWIVKGIQEEVYPCKPDIFEATYERVEE